MPDHLAKKNVVLFGVGKMGVEYAKVLQALGCELWVVGRSQSGVESFYQKTSIPAIAGGYPAWDKRADAQCDFAIVAVDIEELAGTTARLINKGIKNILVEKPADLNKKEIVQLQKLAKKARAKVYVAYNRRFYASVLKAQKMIKQDGGATSFQFELTEWSQLIEEKVHNPKVKQHLLICNTSHVVDMAFYLGGRPKELQAQTAGSLSWHPSAARFSGCGKTAKGTLFSYSGDWQAPGRWGVEILTKNFRFIFQPLEELRIQERGSLTIKPVGLNSPFEQKFKPGLYLQTKAFLEKDTVQLKTLDEQVRDFGFYYQMANYK